MMESQARGAQRDSAPINVVTTADVGFGKQLAVLLRSIERTHDVGSVYVWVIAPEGTRSEIGPLPMDRFLRWVLPPIGDGEGWRLPPQFCAPTFHRLGLGTVLPGYVQRVIYLDADTVVKSSLLPLWELDLGNRVLAAVRDVGVPWVGAPGGLKFRELELAPSLPYFNAGVMLVDLDAWRRLKVGDEAVAVLLKVPVNLADQCALNAAVAGDWMHLEPRWNLQARYFEESFAPVVHRLEDLDRSVADPVIIHFSTTLIGRPWAITCNHPLKGEWFDLLDETTYAGWRPTRPSRLAGIGRRLRRAGLVMLHG